MSSNINTVLADCEQQAKVLVDEIEKYRAAGILSEQTAKSLEKLSAALRETQNRIRPFTEIFARRTLMVLGAILLINFGLLVTILVVLLNR